LLQFLLRGFCFGDVAQQAPARDHVNGRVAFRCSGYGTIRLGVANAPRLQRKQWRKRPEKVRGILDH